MEAFAAMLSNTVVFLLGALAITGLQCTQVSSENQLSVETVGTIGSNYWHQGKAEVSRFDLEQVRYGQTYHGHAVLIFVKEQLLPETQVKFDGLATSEKAVDVMKHIATRDFNTGVYPYSVMTSVFSPFEDKGRHAYKVTGTTQDWCGQTFLQLNNRDGRFSVQYHSYFQSEGDQDFTVDQAFLEDDLWALVRTNPGALPVGDISLYPSTHCVQLQIRQFYPHKAIGRLDKQLERSVWTDSLNVYTVRYTDIPRTLVIMFEPDFPYAIHAWEETEENLAERKGTSPMRTRGVRTHSLMVDYWNRSSIADSTYRPLLGLE
jgi:hypothetical protein